VKQADLGLGQIAGLAKAAPAAALVGVCSHIGAKNRHWGRKYANTPLSGSHIFTHPC